MSITLLSKSLRTYADVKAADIAILLDDIGTAALHAAFRLPHILPIKNASRAWTGFYEPGDRILTSTSSR